MKKTRIWQKKFIDVIALPVPHSIWKNIEIVAQRAQGKGWGANSISQEVNVISNLASKAGIRRIVALDAGANSGGWSLALAKKNPNCKIYSVEPSKMAYGVLKQNTSQFSNVITFNIALGDINKKQKIYFDTPGSEQASLINRRLEHFGTSWKKSEVVQVFTIDTFIERELLEVPNVIKLDIEGFEFAALNGAKDTLKKVKIVQFEFGGTCIDTKVYFQDFWYFFLDAGFSLFRFGPKGLFEIKSYSELDESFSVTNFFAVRN